MRSNSQISEQEGATSVAPSSRQRSQTPLRIFLIVCALVFAALGAWQVQRLFWKLDLIAKVDARVHAPAVTPPASLDADAAKAQEYLHVTVSGTFAHDKEALVQAVTELGPGFWVMTPLTLEDGRTVLINRGYVPADKRDPATRQAGEVAGTVNVVGLLRPSEPKGGFLRSNDPAQNRWYSRDVEAIAAARQLGPVQPYFIDADATANPGGSPVGGLTVVQFRNSHLSYALTWFALAAMSIGAMIYIARRQGHPDDE